MPLYPDTRPYKPEQASVFDSPLTSAIYTFLKMTGLANPQDQVLAPMGAMEVGPSGGIVGAIQKYIKAYHGSPHDFDQFSLDKIGTGEGAQAYGHGLYFADNPNVAQTYRDALSAAEIRKPGGGVLPVQSEAEHVAAAHLDNAVSSQSSAPYQHAASTIRRLAASAEGDAKRRYEAALSVLADWGGQGATVGPKGRMYEVAIHASPDQLLDWDKPLSQQSESIQKLAGQLQQGGRFELGPEATGSKLYGAMEAQLDRAFGQGKIAKDPSSVAARELSNRGIPGLKYLDGGSRAAGEGSRNYVIWDESKVEILKKYGIALPVIEAMRREAMANGGKIEVQ